MVMATFVAIFMVALVYHVAGVGKAALEAQTMQDAADSVAFSTATADARGMNVIALINLVMAAVLSVLVALKVHQAVLIVAIAVVGVLCVVTQGAACGAIQPLGTALNKVNKIIDEVEPRVKDVLEGLESAADVIARVTPILAQAEAVYISTRDVHDPAKIGFAWPLAEELPVTEGSFEELCEKAGETVVETCTFFLPGDLPDFAMETVGELVGEMAGTFSAYFCGGSDTAPDGTREEEVAYPVSDHPECDSSGAQPSSGGGCGSEECERCSGWGCAACVGKMGASNYLKGQWTRTVDVWVEIEQEGGYVHKMIESSGESEVVWLDDDPCDGEAACGGEYICASEDEENAGSGYPDGARRITRNAYKYLHACIVEEEIEVEVPGEPIDADEWPKPKALDEEEVPEGLRVRGFVLGSTRRAGRLEKVSIAGGDPGDGVPGRISFAAADFLSPDMDLWHMNWRSRLIRFRLGGGEEGFSESCSGAFAAECSQVGGQVDAFGGDGGFEVPGLEDAILH